MPAPKALGHQHNNGGQAPPHHPAQHGAQIPAANNAAGRHIVQLPHRKHLGAHHPGIGRYGGKTQDENKHPHAVAKGGNQGQGQHNARDGHLRLNQAHEHIVHSPAEIACRKAYGHAHHRRHQHRQHANEERHAGAVHNAAEQIPPMLVCAENVLPGRAFQDAFQVNGIGVVRREERGSYGANQEKQDYHSRCQHNLPAEQDTEKSFRFFHSALPLYCSRIRGST